MRIKGERGKFFAYICTEWGNPFRHISESVFALSYFGIWKILMRRTAIETLRPALCIVGLRPISYVECGVSVVFMSQRLFQSLKVVDAKRLHTFYVLHIRHRGPGDE